LYSVYNENKSCIIERFNRTLKNIKYKHFDANNTYKWVDNLQTFIDEYNNKKRSTIKMKPFDAFNNIEKYEPILLKLQQERYQKLQLKINKPPQFKILDLVRIARIKGIFEKGYLGNWSKEIFRVLGIKYSYPYKYYLEDLKGNK